MPDISKYTISDAEKYNSFPILKFGSDFGVGTCLMNRFGCKGFLSVTFGGVCGRRLDSKGREG